MTAAVVMSARKEQQNRDTPEVTRARRDILAAQRKLKAMAARDHLIDFTEFTMPDPTYPEDSTKTRYSAQPIHRLVAEHLEKVEQGVIQKLIIEVPPRHGKSELASRKLIPWVVGRDPYRSVLFGAYNDTLALDFGRDVRGCLELNEFKQVFPNCVLKEGSRSADRLRTTEGGQMVFLGRGGAATGRGGDFIVIDDPIKNSVEAGSQAIRDEAWKWLSVDMLSRSMSDQARAVLIMSRWHEDDPVGRLTDPENPYYNEEEAAQWTILHVPAIAGMYGAPIHDPLGRAAGEPLWPEKFGREYLEAFRRRNPREFYALYQCRPTPEDGVLFKADMIRPYRREMLPKNLRIYAASDHAVTQKQENDRTCLLIVGVDADDNIYLLDCWWKHATTDVVVEAMIDLMEKWRPLLWWAESGHISKSIGPFLKKRMRERRVYSTVSESPSFQDKRQKAQPILGRMSMGMVHFPLGAPWLESAKQEMFKFDRGRHDDFVDALSHIGMGLNRLVGAAKTKPPKNEPAVGTYAWIKQSSLNEKRNRERVRLAGGM